MVGVVSRDMSHDIAWTEICKWQFCYEKLSLKLRPIFLAADSPVSMVTEGVSWEVFSFGSDAVPYEAILVKPCPSSTPPPLAVFPHGIYVYANL